MEKVKIIPIEYDEKNKEEALKIEKMLKKNSLIFHCLFAEVEKITFLESSNLNCIKISNFDDLKAETSHSIPRHIALMINQIMMNSEEPIGVTFLQTMILDKIDGFKNYSLDIVGDEKESYVNLIYTLAAMGYYFNQETPEKIVDFVYYLPQDEKQKIYTWLKDKHRYDLFNHLLVEQYKILIQENEDYEIHDKFLANNLDKVIQIAQDSYVNNKLYTLQPNQCLDDVKLSKKELNKLFGEFLLKIDPSLKWLKIYNELHKENKIIYEPTTKDNQKEWRCIEKEEGEYYILAPLEGTIRDFRNLTHEFAHYISLIGVKEVDYLQPSIKEFPSLFFEMYISNFLKDKGYSEEIIDHLLEERELWTKHNIEVIEAPLRYLQQSLSEGPITEEVEKQRLKQLNDNIYDGLPENIKSILTKITSPDDEENIHRAVDSENMKLLQEPSCVAAAYPYVVGQYLAKKALDKLSENSITIYTFLEITENLSRETIQTIVNKLDLETDFCFSEESNSINNQKTKQTKPE